MTKHIFTACLGTETHTWAPLPTDNKAFEATYVIRNGKHPEAVNMFGVPLQIWKRRASAKGWRVTEGLCAFATPSGQIGIKTAPSLFTLWPPTVGIFQKRGAAQAWLIELS